MEQTKQLLLEFRHNRDFRHFSDLSVITPGIMEDLLSLCLSAEYPYPQYSSWLLAHISALFPEELARHHDALVDILLASADHSVQRNTANALQNIPRTPYREGELLDRLFRFLLASETKVALKAYSMRLILPFTEEYPELKEELRSIIETGMSHESPAYIAAGKQILKKIPKK